MTQGQGDGAVTAAVIWDGIAGAALSAIVAGIVSALVALWVVRLTQKGQRNDALESESRAAAGQLTVGLIALRHQAGLIAGAGMTGAERAERRRELSTDAGQVFNLHAPALQEATLRRDAESVHRAVLDFLSLSDARDVGRWSFPARFADPWHKEAHSVLGRSIAGLIERLKLHRLGEPVPSEPLPEPEWPTTENASEGNKG